MLIASVNSLSINQKVGFCGNGASSPAAQPLHEALVAMETVLTQSPPRKEITPAQMDALTKLVDTLEVTPKRPIKIPPPAQKIDPLLKMLKARGVGLVGKRACRHAPPTTQSRDVQSYTTIGNIRCEVLRREISPNMTKYQVEWPQEQVGILFDYDREQNPKVSTYGYKRGKRLVSVSEEKNETLVSRVEEFFKTLFTEA